LEQKTIWEFEVYASVPDNFPKYVISMDGFDMNRDGVKFFAFHWQTILTFH